MRDEASFTIRGILGREPRFGHGRSAYAFLTVVVAHEKGRSNFDVACFGDVAEKLMERKLRPGANVTVLGKLGIKKHEGKEREIWAPQLIAESVDVLQKKDTDPAEPEPTWGDDPGFGSGGDIPF